MRREGEDTRRSLLDKGSVCFQVRCSDERRRGSGVRDWSAAVSAANLLLEISAVANSGCGLVYVIRQPNYKENRQIASYVEKLHNVLLSAVMDGGIIICGVRIMIRLYLMMSW